MTAPPGKIPLLCVLLAGAVVAVASPTRDEIDRERRGWLAPLAAAERALDRGDVQAALRFTEAARTAAFQSRRWEAHAETADMLLRIGALTGAQQAAVEEARRRYHTALFRARADGSIAGVLRSGDAFARLGDRAMARGALAIAESLAGSSAAGRSQVDAFRDRWRDRLALPATEE